MDLIGTMRKAFFSVFLISAITVFNYFFSFLLEASSKSSDSIVSPTNIILLVYRRGKMFKTFLQIEIFTVFFLVFLWCYENWIPSASQRYSETRYKWFTVSYSFGHTNLSKFRRRIFVFKNVWNLIFDGNRKSRGNYFAYYFFDLFGYNFYGPTEI